MPLFCFDPQPHAPTRRPGAGTLSIFRGIEGKVRCERGGDSNFAALGLVIPAKIDSMKLDVEERASKRFVSKKIVGAEGERGQAIVIVDLVGQASLVVVVGQLVVGGDQREQRAGVPVATAKQNTAALVGEGLLDHRSRVEDSRLCLSSRGRARRRGLPGHDAAGIPTEARGIDRRKKVDPIDERWRDDRRTGAYVK